VKAIISERRIFQFLLDTAYIWFIPLSLKFALLSLHLHFNISPKHFFSDFMISALIFLKAISYFFEIAV